MTPDEMRQIQDLYHAAREDRGVLNSADPELRRLVESLLAKEGSLPELARTMTRLATGSLLGPYRVEEFLGAGGMGEVFRAIDTRLGRNVALKVSASQFSERFEREARAISALNHPHICTLYDVGPNYLVMEFIEGASLAALLKKGALSRDRVMQYGLQIAEALVEAHAKGITHRDLKPGNIMVTKMGVNKTGIKVLDFGLAKKADETHTLGNAIMGTPAYMAPEQRQGQEADARSDIYSFGLVLFEMATGKRVAPGERPQLDSFPERLAHVLEHCLEQDPDDRWQTARNVKAELEWAAKPGEASSAQGLPAAPALPRRWSWRFAAGFTCCE